MKDILTIKNNSSKIFLIYQNRFMKTKNTFYKIAN